MASETQDPRITRIRPRIRYNTIGGVNGPLVILDNVGEARYSVGIMCLILLLAN